jgi:hypothetical protein
VMTFRPEIITLQQADSPARSQMRIDARLIQAG